MTTFGDKVRNRRLELKLSQPDLGKKAGLTYQAIQQIEDGSSKSTRRLLQLAEALQVPADWLTSETDSPPPSPSASEDPAPLMPVATSNLNIPQMQKDVPVRGGALCGDDGLFEFNGEALDYVRRPPRLLGVRDAYALYANGTSMSPWRESGKLVYVHPHLPVEPGDYVVVQVKPAREGDPIRAYIKRLVRRTARELVLAQHNPSKEIGIPTKSVLAIHKIPDWDELMSF